MNPERQRLIDAMFNDDPQVLTPDRPEDGDVAKAAGTYDSESEQIVENRKEWGGKTHRFLEAEWTHKNGHPRCIRCGDEQPEDGLCMPELQKWATMLEAWSVKYAAEFAEKVDGTMELQGSGMPSWIEQFHSECITKSAPCSVQWPVCPVTTKAWSDAAREAGAAAKPDVPSRAAHAELDYSGWQHQGEGRYTHPDLPGHEITVGAQGTGGTAHNGRNTVSYTSWTHKEPDGKTTNGRGVDSLGYHAQQTRLRSGTRKNETPVEKYITHDGDKWTVHAESGKVLGTHDSEAEAQAQLRAIEVNKDGKGDVIYPVTPNLPNYGRSPLTGEKAPNQKAMKALQAAFLAFAKAAGIVVKREEVVCDAVETTDTGTIYKVEYGVGHAFFKETDGQVEHLARYVQRKNALHPIAKAEAQRYTLGAVYAPGEVDYHGDTMTEPELEKAAWAYAQKDGMTARVGLMHQAGTNGAGRVVESYIYRGPVWKMKDASGADQTIVPGTWMLGVVWEPEAWARVERKELTGYSLQGVARKFASDGKEI